MPRILKRPTTEPAAVRKKIEQIPYGEEFKVPGDEELYHSVTEENPRINSVLIQNRLGRSKRVLFGSVVELVGSKQR